MKKQNGENYNYTDNDSDSLTQQSNRLKIMIDVLLV